MDERKKKTKEAAHFILKPLEKVDAAEAELTGKVFRYLPDSIFPGECYSEIKEMLQGIFPPAVEKKYRIGLSGVLKKPGRIREIIEKKFDSEEIILGRHKDTDFRIPDGYISGKHAKVYRKADKFFLSDLNSVNNTYLNGRILRPGEDQEISNGDEITLANTKLSLTIEVEEKKTESIGIRLTRRKQKLYKGIRETISEPCSVLVFNLHPVEHKCFIEIDLMLGFALYDHLLGGSGDVRVFRAFTAMEEGAVQFLVLKILNLLTEKFGSNPPVHPRLEKMIRSRSELDKEVDFSVPYIESDYTVNLGRASGFVKLFLPDLLLEKYDLIPGETGYSDTAKENEFLMSRFRSIDEIRIPLICDMGYTPLSLVEISSLERDNIIAVENTKMFFGEDGLSGEATLYCGARSNGGYSIDAAVNSGEINVTLKERFSKGERSMSEEIEEKKKERVTGESALKMTETARFVADNVTVPVVVELGRIQMPLRDIIRLKEGETMSLEKSPIEPVDLTADDKVIAKGKLVDLQGKIGVKIIKLGSG